MADPGEMLDPARVQATWRPGVIDLGPGHPDEGLLPLELLGGAAAERLARPDASLLQYGAEKGDERFRRLLSGAIGAETGAAPDPDSLFVTAGASQGLALVCTLFTRPGDTVLVAEPSYFLALEIFADHGLNVVAVPCDEQGPLPEALQAALNGAAPRFLYLVPSFANPTGVTVSPERLEAVVELTARAGTLVVADEVYRFLQFDGAPPAGLAGAGLEHVVSLNSFSKILAPGLRLGWLEGPRQLLDRVEGSGFLRSGGGLNPFVAAIVGELLAGGRLGEHLAGLRATYAQRAGALADALRAHAPQLEFTEPDGGYFIWARLKGADPARLRAHARQRGIDYAPGAAFSSSGGHADRLRLSFSHYAPSELAEGAARLGAAVAAELEGLSPNRQGTGAGPSDSTIIDTEA